MLIDKQNIIVPDPGCKICAGPLPFEFTFAYQPIINFRTKDIFAFEALVRGPDAQGAKWVLDQIQKIIDIGSTRNAGFGRSGSHISLT